MALDTATMARARRYTAALSRRARRPRHGASVCSVTTRAVGVPAVAMVAATALA